MGAARRWGEGSPRSTLGRSVQDAAGRLTSAPPPTRRPQPEKRPALFARLARMFHEFPDLSVQVAPPDWSIVRRFIVVAMDQGGSADMASEMERQTGSGTRCHQPRTPGLFDNLMTQRRKSAIGSETREICGLGCCSAGDLVPSAALPLESPGHCSSSNPNRLCKSSMNRLGAPALLSLGRSSPVMVASLK